MKVEKIHLPTAGLVAIKDKKLLLAYSIHKQAWYLPGGKVDVGETALQSVQREVLEELNVELKADGLKYYCHVSAPAYGEPEHVTMQQDCFLYNLVEEVKASNEIGELKYFDLESYLKEPAQVVGVLKVFENLHNDKLL